MLGIFHGVFPVWKPVGPSSNDVVQKIRRVLETQLGRLLIDTRLRVGHGGTLDPMAEGVLVIGVGNGCKVMGGFQKGGKAYRAVGKLGVETDSQDCLGKTLSTAPFDHVNAAAIEGALKGLIGVTKQKPPIFSALKVAGKRAYDLARKGQVPELQPREILINEASLLAFDSPYFKIDIDCGGGTYVRTIIHDIGKKVNSAAHMTELVRLRQGPYEKKDCLHKEEWDFFKIQNALIKWRQDSQNLELLQSRGLEPDAKSE